jgi:hypothetical protein
MEQNYKNHSRLVPGHHFVAGGLLLLTTVGATRNLFQSLDDDHRLYNASLILIIVVILWFVWAYSRAFALKAQDRVIILEEKIRHQQLTGRALNSQLRPAQIIALRFASDAELPALAERAATENLGSKQIKQVINNWKADHHRV